MKNKKSSVSFSVALLTLALCIPCGAVWAVPSTAKPIDVMGLTPIGLQNSGSVISHISQSGDAFFWDAATGKQTTLVQSPGLVSPAYYYTSPVVPRKVEASHDGRFLLNHQYTGSAVSQLFLIDTSAPTTPYLIPETRNIASVPKISPDSQAYAFVGKLDPTNYYMSQSLWTLDLNEYVWDLAMGMLQPTGYYLKTIHKGSNSAGSPTYYAYPETIGAFTWSNDSKKLAYILSSYDSTRYTSSVALKIYDRSTAKTTEVTSLNNAMTLEWPEGDFIYYATASYNPSGYSSYQVSRLDTVKKTSQSVFSESIDPYTLSVSGDGKFLTASTLSTVATPTAPSQPMPAVLYDIDNKKKYTLQDVTALSFDETGDRVVMQRMKNDPKAPSKPFWIARIQDVIDAAVDAKVEVAKMGAKATPAGEALLSYALPTDPAEFKKEMAYENATFNINGGGFYSYIHLKNISQTYYHFSFKSYSTARCTLYDSTGKELGNNTASLYPLPAGYDNKMTMGPMKSSPMYCSGYLTAPASLPTGTKGKLVYEVLGYEAGSRYEMEVDL